jgi:hypothetical protein
MSFRALRVDNDDPSLIERVFSNLKRPTFLHCAYIVANANFGLQSITAENCDQRNGIQWSVCTAEILNPAWQQWVNLDPAAGMGWQR